MGGKDPFVVCEDSDIEVAAKAAAWAAFLNSGQVCTSSERIYVQRAVALSGGRRPGGFQKGFYYEPTVLINVNHTMNVMREETFGPVAPVMPYDDFDEAIRYAQDTPYRFGKLHRGVDRKIAYLRKHIIF